MKRIALLLAAAACFAACKDSKPAETPLVETPKEEAESKPAVTFPYTATYSSDFSMGDPELTKKVLDMYKALEAGNVDTLAVFYADTVNWRNFAQENVNLPRQVLIKRIKEFRSQFKAISETPIAFTALHSNDKSEDWVITWIKENVTYPNGRKDSTTYQECWRFRDGKVYMHDSYAKYRR